MHVSLLLLLLNHTFLKLFGALHVLDSPIIRVFTLHGEFDAKNHVASAGPTIVHLLLEELSCRSQIEERLVAEC